MLLSNFTLRAAASPLLVKVMVRSCTSETTSSSGGFSTKMAMSGESSWTRHPEKSERAIKGMMIFLMVCSGLLCIKTFLGFVHEEWAYQTVSNYLRVTPFLWM